MVPDNKKALRRDARITRKSLHQSQPDFPEKIAAYAADLCAVIAKAGLPKSCIIAGYHAVRSEADPAPLMLRLAAAGHSLALPCVTRPDTPLTFRLYTPGAALRPGAYGINEPELTAKIVIPRIILVPLLAFDAAGYRLGYGGGYYDRTLALLRARGPVLAIGIAYDGQVLPTTSPDAHDARLDGLITETGCKHFPLTDFLP